MRVSLRATPLAAMMVLTLALVGCSSSNSASKAPPSSSTTTTSLGPARSVGPLPSAGCRARHAVAHGISDHTMVSGGLERAYELDVPDNYDGTKPYAIVFGLHALTVSYKFIPSMVGFEQAGRYHFIGVSPSGRVNGTTPYWNAAPVAANEDVAFIARLLTQLESTLCIDTSRVFSTGMSNGAQMSSLLACRLPNRITAIAPVSGEEFLTPCDGAPVPIMAFHGTADPILPYSGGGLNATRIATLYRYGGQEPAGLPKPLGIDASMRLWAAHNGCDPTPVETRVTPHVRERRWQHCRAATVLYIVVGAGHSWPGKPVPQFENEFGGGTTEIDATNLMFGFFFGNSR